MSFDKDQIMLEGSNKDGINDGIFELPEPVYATYRHGRQLNCCEDANEDRIVESPNPAAVGDYGFIQKRVLAVRLK